MRRKLFLPVFILLLCAPPVLADMAAIGFYTEKGTKAVTSATRQNLKDSKDLSLKVPVSEDWL